MPFITFVLLLKTEAVKICFLNRIISLQQRDYEGSQHLLSFSYFNSLVTKDFGSYSRLLVIKTTTIQTVGIPGLVE